MSTLERRLPQRAAAHAIPDRFDAVVIGSGMGGLTCASLLAQRRGLRVLVLERHYRLGGFTHGFDRPGQRHWDVGLHYVGRMGEGSELRGLMDLVTGGAVDWTALPTPFEQYHYPGLTIGQPPDRAAYEEKLASLWPAERAGIRRYFDRVEATARWLTPYLLSTGGPPWLRVPARVGRRLAQRKALQTTAAVLAECVRSPELRAVLASQWGDYGLPPRASAFIVHAMVVSHYLKGGWFPVGGAGGIAEGARARIEAAGGLCLTGYEVDQVLLRHGRAIGVQASHWRDGRRESSRDFLAPVVVSDAGARLTYGRLLPDDVPLAVQACREELRRMPRSSSVVQLFLGLRDSAATLGFRGENHWHFAAFDHDALYDWRNALPDGEATTAYLSFPSLKDPHAAMHSAKIIAPLDKAAVSRWIGRSWQQRGDDYDALKANVADTLLDFVERHHPGLRALVDYQELATPLSVEHFAAHPHGAVYGLPAVPARYAASWLGTTTPVPGLLLTGSDVCGHGIVGAMLGGVGAAAHILGGASFFGIMRSAQRQSRTPRVGGGGGRSTGSSAHRGAGTGSSAPRLASHRS